MSKLKKELINRFTPLNVLIVTNLSEIDDANKKAADDVVNLFTHILRHVLTFSPLLKVTDNQDNNDVVMTISVTEGKVQMRIQYGALGYSIDTSTQVISSIAPEEVEGYLYRVAYDMINTHKDNFFTMAREKYVASKRVTHCNYDYKVINEIKARGDNKLAQIALAYEEVLNNLVRKAAEADKEKPVSDLHSTIAIRIIYDSGFGEKHVVVQLEKKAPPGWFHDRPLQTLNVKGRRRSIDVREARRIADETSKEDILQTLQEDYITPMDSLSVDMPVTSAVKTTQQWAGIIELSFRQDWPRQLEEVKEFPLLPLEATTQEDEPVLFILPEPRPFVFVLDEVDSLPPETNMFMEELRKLYAVPSLDPDPIVFNVNAKCEEGEDVFMLQVCYKGYEIHTLRPFRFPELRGDNREDLRYTLDVLHEFCVENAYAPFLMQRAGQTVVT